MRYKGRRQAGDRRSDELQVMGGSSYLRPIKRYGMRKYISLFAILITLLAGACSKSSSGPTSAEGNWKYTTPDGKVSVTFTLVKNTSGSLDISSYTYAKDGVTYLAAGTISGVNLPAIGSIRINANDPKAVYPYYIQFTTGTVSSDFKRIDVVSAEYSYPGLSDIKTLSNISIGRP